MRHLDAEGDQEASIDAIGGASGAVMRRATFQAIQKDAPMGALGLKLTREEVQRRVADDLGIDFQFVIMEHQVDVFTDGGIATVRRSGSPSFERLYRAADQALYEAKAAGRDRITISGSVPSGLTAVA